MSRELKRGNNLPIPIKESETQISSPLSSAAKKGKAAMDIERQLAMLKWKKIQNQSQIRQTIETSRSLQEQDLLTKMASDKGSERVVWMHHVIQDELRKPLEVPEDRLRKYQLDEKEELKKALSQVTLQEKAIQKAEETLIKKEKDRQRFYNLQEKKKRLHKPNEAAVQTTLPSINQGAAAAVDSERGLATPSQNPAPAVQSREQLQRLRNLYSEVHAKKIQTISESKRSGVNSNEVAALTSIPDH